MQSGQSNGNRVSVVTGGNRGIGLGMARGLAAAGHRIMIWGRNPEHNARAVAELQAAGAQAAATACDVSQPDQVQAAMQATLQRFGRLDALVANAGISSGKARRMHELDLDDFHRIFRINVDGVVLSLQAAIRAFLDQGEGGALVVTSSLAGIEGAGRNSAYGATKGAVLSLMRAVAVEYARDGIRINAVLPGWIATEMTQGSQDNPKFTDKVISRVPIRRWGQPDDFAALAAYLCGPGSAYVTGQQFIVDGGYTIF